MAIVLLLAVMLVIAAMRVFLPVGARVPGRPLGDVSLSWRERLLLQRTNMYLFGAVVLLGAASGALTGPLELVALLAAFAILTIPVRYRFTSEGIARNNVVFRAWSDFAGYREERSALVLEAVAGQRDFRLHVTGAHREAARRAVARLLSQHSHRRPRSPVAASPRTPRRSRLQGVGGNESCT